MTEHSTRSTTSGSKVEQYRAGIARGRTDAANVDNKFREVLELARREIEANQNSTASERGYLAGLLGGFRPGPLSTEVARKVRRMLADRDDQEPGRDHARAQAERAEQNTTVVAHYMQSDGPPGTIRISLSSALERMPSATDQERAEAILRISLDDPDVRVHTVTY